MGDDHSEVIPARALERPGHEPSIASEPGFAEDCARHARLTRQADRKDAGLEAFLDAVATDAIGSDRASSRPEQPQHPTIAR
ncbi:antitoxin MazE-like protein [Peteryoungia aggregata]|uniref:antitoxin MazE-like protein n=1 Tax=Peteryoungia aggregata TaxID=34013 RepID=UPI00352141B6